MQRRISEPGGVRQVYLVSFDAPAVAQFRRQIGLDPDALSPIMFVAGAGADFNSWLPQRINAEADCLAPDRDRPLMDLYDIPVTTIDGETITLDRYRGKALLIVNVASRCGFTPQYEGLEALYRKHKDKGFVVLGFPCNQFGRQEPGSEAEIRSFCDEHYSVTFPLFAKIDVNGPNAHPLYRYLKSAKKGLLGRETIAWNFTKFLVGRNGRSAAAIRPSPHSRKTIEKDVAGLV